MKKFFILYTFTLVATLTINAQKSLSIKDIVDGEFRAVILDDVTPLENDYYAMISKDNKEILKYSFKTAKQVDVLFRSNSFEIDDFIISPDEKKILIQTNTKKIYRRSFKADYYIYNISTKKLEKLSSSGSEQTPIFSPNSKMIAYVRNNNIFLVDLRKDAQESQVTFDGKQGEIINGIPDWVNEEEFAFSSAMIFSSDSKTLSFIRYDEKNVETYTLMTYSSQEEESSPYPSLYTYKYPKAGEENSKVSVYSYDIDSKQTISLGIDFDNDGYIPRIIPQEKDSKIIVYTLNRHQNELCIYKVDPKTLENKLLIKENTEKYIKEEIIEDIFISSSHILIPSDKTGYTQLYLYDIDGNFIRQVTSFNYDVTSVYGYDEETGNTYYQAAGKNPLSREVYVTSKDGKTKCLTQNEGWNSSIFSKNFKYFINTWSDSNTPYEFFICDNQSEKLFCLEDNNLLKEKLKTYGITNKEFFQFNTLDGITLDGVMIKPKDFSLDKKYPLIIWQYSGPGSQEVKNSWSMGSVSQGCLFDEYLCQEGFIVAIVDTRGTMAKGKEFEKSTYLKLGDLESKDLIEAAMYLGGLSYVDKDNIGIWGWSYGGFNTLMSMSCSENIFKAGVAIAPPTSWRFYDTIYTERYMLSPKENPLGYNDNPINRADKLHGKLLLCQGLLDDNVHTQNIFEYIAALENNDKDYLMNLYTNKNHSIIGGNSRNHLLRRVSCFFKENLKSEY